MASNYTGSPSSTQAPSPTPGPNVAQVVSVPAGSDALSIESITQWAKVNADFSTWASRENWLQRYQENYQFGNDTLAAYTSTQAPIPNYGQLSAVMSGTGASVGAILVPIVGWTYTGRMLGLVVGTAANAYCFLASTAQLFRFDGSPANLSLRIDMMASVAQATNNSNLFLGMSSTQFFNTGTAPAHGTGFFLANGTATWQMACEGTTSAVSATYNPTNSATTAWQLLRVEWFGASTPQGVANANTAFARFSMTLPGSTAMVQVGTINGTPTINQYICIGGWQPNAVSSRTLYTGPFTAVWNQA